MKTKIEKFFKKHLPPKIYFLHKYLRMKSKNQLDDEMFYVAKLMRGNGRFLDIGSNIGIWAYFMRNKFSKIDAYEPISEITERFRSLNFDHINIHDVALSNNIGKLKFFIPLDANGTKQTGLSSLEHRHGKCEERIVDVKTLDTYAFDDVKLIKVDVEGHEQSVILGAIETLRKCSPILVVEIEQRHLECDISDVFKTILELNYEGFFLVEGNLIKLTQFTYEKYQKPFLKNVVSKEYINNFIFIPNSKLSVLSKN